MKKLLLILNFVFGIIIFITPNIYSQSYDYSWIYQLGGSGWDQPNAITIDNEDNIYLIGEFTETIDLITNHNDSSQNKLESKGNKDIIFLKMNSSGKVLWVKQIGGKSYDNASDIKLDSQGNIYIVGSFQKTIYFKKDSINSFDYTDGFIAKYNKNSKLIWLRHIGGQSSVNNRTLDIDKKDNIIVGGIFNNKILLNNNEGKDNLTSNGNSDVFIIKYDKNGDLQWKKQIGGIGEDWIYDIKCNQNNNVFITGYFSDTLKLQDTVTLHSNGGTDMFFCKLDENGNLIWINHAGGILNDLGKSITLDKKDNILIAGEFTNYIDFNKLVRLKSNGYKDEYLAKYNQNGKLIFAKQVGGKYNDYVSNIIIDKKNNIVLNGEIKKLKSFGKTSFTSKQANSNICLAGFTSNGIPEMPIHTEKNNLVHFRSIIYDNMGNLYITGAFRKSINFGKNDFTSKGSKDIFIAKMTNPCNIFEYDLGDDINICYGDSIILNAGEGFINYKWDNGLTDKTRLVKEEGKFYVDVLNENGCSYSDTILVSINKLPFVEFKVEANYPGQVSNFLDQSIGNDYIIEWDWNFGDKKGKSEEQNPSYTFTKSGTYFVTLSVTNENGCIDSKTKKIKINKPLEYFTSYNYPNPFIQSTEIIYILPNTASVKIQIFNLLGNILETKEYIMQSPGMHKINFSGSNLKPGVYLYKIIVQGENNTYMKVNNMIKQIE